MTDTITTAILTTIVLLLAPVLKPQRATCPPGRVLATGIRTQPIWGQDTGQFCCQPPPIGGDRDVKHWTGKSTAVQPPGLACGQLRCTNGQLPIVKNHVTVGCQQRH